MAPLDAPDAPDAASALAACEVSTTSGDREPSSVHINEALAGSLRDDQDDWFEIHSAGQQPVALNGWSVEDFFTGDLSKNVPGHFEFPPDTVLCPGHFLDVRRGDACEADAHSFDFGSATPIGSCSRMRREP